MGCHYCGGSLTELEKRSWEATKLLVDVYKHHFDLFMKAYVVQLALVGAVAGYVFRPETDKTTKLALLCFAMLVCLVSALAWTNGLLWQGRLKQQLAKCAPDPELAKEAISSARYTLMLGIAGSAVIFIVGAAAFVKYAMI